MTRRQLNRANVLWLIFTSSQVALAGLLVAFIAGSLLFVGGRVAPMQNEAWPQLWAWPVFTVPGWLPVALAVVGAAVVMPMSVLTPAAMAPRLLGAISQAFAAGGAAVLFSGLFPAETGVMPMPSGDGLFLGLHWVAVPLSLFSIGVLVIALLAKGGEHERSRRTGGLLP